jgi:2-(1,2-epoxy-1,2-dihydrophenyl)acetyl-CoA isomerase
MSTVLFEVKDSVAYITLNRPEKYNAFNREMSLSIQQRLEESKSSEIRCVHITGAGKAFSSGQDLLEATNQTGLTVNTIIKEHYNPIIQLIRNLEKPVLAAVNGIAAGAAANIAICCDVVVAARSATFIQAFSKIGLIPDSAGTFFLPRLIGLQKASALCMLGDKVSADEAEKLGMIYKVFDDDTFVEESVRTANTLAQLPTKGLALTKRALNESFKNTLEEQLQEEELLQERAAVTHDFKEGINAFLEKRTPNFKGE